MLNNVHTLASPAALATVPTSAQYTIRRYGRFWRVLDPTGDLVCITVYKCGAREVVHRLCTDDMRGASKPAEFTTGGRRSRKLRSGR